MPDPSISTTLSTALDNPNVQNYLHMISSAEGTADAGNPYAVGFGGTNIDDLSQHPGTRHTFTQTDGTQNVTTAAGAYQFIKPTWDGIQKVLKLPDFGPRSQDLGAVYLLNQNGSLQDVMDGNYQVALEKDGKTWASLPTSTAAQQHRSSDFISRTLSGGGEKGSELDAVSAPKLFDAFQRAQAAQDTDVMQQLSAALTPRLQQGLQAAQASKDTEAMSQFQDMLTTLGQQPKQPQGQPAHPSMWEKIGNAVTHPVDTATVVASALKDGAVEVGNRFVEHPLKTIDDWVRGAADNLTFGAADKLAALADSAIKGTAYKDELAKQRQQDQAGGAAFHAGQLSSVFLPGAGSLSLVSKATQAVPTTSRLIRMAAGATAGSAEGAASYLGHSDGPVNGSDMSASMALGALGGSIPGAVTAATQGQKAATFLRQAGGDVANAQRDAEIIQGLQDLASRSTQGSAKLGPADANALATGYTQRAGDAVRQMGPSQENKALLTAMDRTRGLTDDQINALRTTAQGSAVADAIQMRQRALSMTSPTPAKSGLVVQAARIAADNLIPVAPLRHLAMNVLGGRENRTANIAQALGQADNAAAFLGQYGGSQASKSALDLAQMGQTALAARQAATAMAQRPAQQVTQAQAALQALQAQQQRNALTAATRMPLGGGYQTLLQGGASGLNLTSKDANQGLRALANHPVLGAAANEMRQTGVVTDPMEFFAIQNGLRGMKEQGYIGGATPTGAMQTPQPALSDAIRNPIAYKAAVTRNQKMVDAAVQQAPTPQLAAVAQQMGASSSTAMKQQAFNSVMAKASPSEKAYLKTHVEPLIRYGK